MYWYNWGFPSYCCSNNNNEFSWIWIIVIVFILLFLFRGNDCENNHR